MGDTLDNILNLQRIEEGKFELDLHPFDIRKMTEEIVAMYGGVVLEKRIKLVLNSSSTIPSKLIGDGHRISHVLSNLISNALKFSCFGGTITVDVSCGEKRHSPDGSHEIVVISIAVADEGSILLLSLLTPRYQNICQIIVFILFKHLKVQDFILHKHTLCEEYTYRSFFMN